VKSVSVLAVDGFGHGQTGIQITLHSFFHSGPLHTPNRERGRSPSAGSGTLIQRLAFQVYDQKLEAHNGLVMFPLALKLGVSIPALGGPPSLRLVFN